jgi:DNA-binding MarR family transcriptional regulator
MQLRAAYSRLRRSSNQALSALRMSSDQFVVLTVLAEEGEATQQELVRRCHSDTATMGAMAALLEKKGLLERRPHRDDGRAQSLSLTRAGRVLQRRMWRTSAPVRMGLAGLFSGEEYSDLLKYLERLTEAIPPPRRKRASSGPSQRSQRRSCSLKANRP